MSQPVGQVEIRGTIRRIRWQENSRIIAEVEAKGHAKLSIVGDVAGAAEGEEYIFVGALKPNERFGGEELRVASARHVMPTSNFAIHRYLTRTAKWVGGSVADAIIKAFGESSLQILKDEPERVAERISGITPARAMEIAESLRNNEANEKVTIELGQMLSGLAGNAVIERAIKKWGVRAPNVLKANPYRLAQLAGVGFPTADKLYTRLGGKPVSLKRHAHAIVYAITQEIQRSGHTWLTGAQVLEAARKLLGADLDNAAIAATKRAKVVIEDPVRRLWSVAQIGRAEIYIAGKIAALREAPKPPAAFPPIDCTGLAPDQVAAVEAFRNEPVFLLVGSPGTGKTYTIARIVKAMRSGGCEVSLCAPTGKAAKQMSLALRDTCGGAASTIHSLLEPSVGNDGEFRFARDESRPIQAHLIVVDETSMLDVRLMRSLLRAIEAGTRVLFIGDHYQLPSVGPGAVLRDMLAAGVPQYELREIKRNAGDIVRACHSIKDGKPPLPSGADSNWEHVTADTPEDILELITFRLRNQFTGQFNLRWDVQIISPTNETGPLSCESGNEAVRETINPGFVPEGRLPFSVGDKVVRLKNAKAIGIELDESEANSTLLRRRILSGEIEELIGQAQEGVEIESPDSGENDEDDAPRRDEGVRIVNGDIGEVLYIEKSHLYVWFRWPDRVVRLRRDSHELKLAYAMTCHKLQGSETKVAIIPLHQSMSRMPIWNREWLYTAFSRAKTLLITVGNLDALEIGIRRTGANARRTLLRQFISQGASNGSQQEERTGFDASPAQDVSDRSDPVQVRQSDSGPGEMCDRDIDLARLPRY